MDNMLLSFQHMNGGLIMNISSTLAFKPNAVSAIFCGTKRSVLGLTRSLSDSFFYQKYNNRICTLCPGITQTNLTESARKNLCTNELQEEFERTLAYECKQKPEVVATAAVHLIQKAPHGSTWIVENGDLYMIDFPHYKSYCVPKTLRVVCEK
ncbi:hypothetical protein J437_LFUL014150 [Ladona fulva]|uniref:Uncharacterized protein n=1 Tax=Ladona fulva TaxID=123851 RepID=A0A8K0KH94_LADFU|nr:hypothetical protein J437_LFUL014150 [Ladona fulva]